MLSSAILTARLFVPSMSVPSCKSEVITCRVMAIFVSPEESGLGRGAYPGAEGVSSPSLHLPQPMRVELHARQSRERLQNSLPIVHALLFLARAEREEVLP